MWWGREQRGDALDGTEDGAEGEITQQCAQPLKSTQLTAWAGIPIGDTSAPS